MKQFALLSSAPAFEEPEATTVRRVLVLARRSVRDSIEDLAFRLEPANFYGTSTMSL